LAKKIVVGASIIIKEEKVIITSLNDLSLEFI
jgi:hypothetical protein